MEQRLTPEEIQLKAMHESLPKATGLLAAIEVAAFKQLRPTVVVQTPVPATRVTVTVSQSELKGLFKQKQELTLTIFHLSAKRKKYVGRPVWFEIQREIEKLENEKAEVVKQILAVTGGA